MDDRIVLILNSCLGAWIKDLKNYDTKRDIAGYPVENANYGVFGQALCKAEKLFGEGKVRIEI